MIMTHLTGTFTTPNSSKFLGQLCKHFSHKVEATFDETSGTVQFPFGPAVLSAAEDALSVRFEDLDANAIDSAKHVIDSHLETFAFREKFKQMDWASA
jgi:hypothetical protein